MNLDESWSTLASTLATTLTNEAIVDEVKGALLDEGSRRGEGNPQGAHNPDTVMVVRTSRGVRRGMRPMKVWRGLEKPYDVVAQSSST